MTSEIDMPVSMIAGLLDSIIEEMGAKDKREHERRLKELQIIESSNLKDEYTKQLLLDRILYPIEKAQHDIQNAAKHAQWVAEIISSHYKDHGLNQEQAQALSTQLRLLAVQITHVDSLHDLKFVYAIVTMFNDKVSVFKHAKREYCIHHTIRHGILDKLNTCIATGNNFRVREELMRLMTGQDLPGLESPK